MVALCAPRKCPKTTLLSKMWVPLGGRSIASPYPQSGRRNEVPGMPPTNHPPCKTWFGDFLWGWRSWQNCFLGGKLACKPARLIIFCLKAINICFLDKVTRLRLEGEQSYLVQLQLWTVLESITLRALYCEILSISPNPLESPMHRQPKFSAAIKYWQKLLSTESKE